MSEILFVCGGGIGNLVQATPAIQAIAAEGHAVDILPHCNSSKDVHQILNIPAVRRVLLSAPKNQTYDYQMTGPFTPGYKHPARRYIRSKIHYAQHIAEAEVYYDMAKQIGVNTPMPDCQINIKDDGRRLPERSIAIFPGSKKNWAMKRWDKYDKLAHKLMSGRKANIVVVGQKDDIYSQGSPAWFHSPWKWPSKTNFFQGSLADVASTISNCEMFIGNDGGIAHLAAATGITTFVLFGPSSVIKNKPYSKNAHAIYVGLPCQPCQFTKGSNGQYIFNSDRANCPYGMRCQKHLSVEMVIDQIKSVYQGVQCQNGSLS